MKTQKDRKAERQKDRQKDKNKERQKDRKTDRKIKTQKDRKTERQKDRKTERQKDRKTEHYQCSHKAASTVLITNPSVIILLFNLEMKQLNKKNYPHKKIIIQKTLTLLN